MTKKSDPTKRGQNISFKKPTQQRGVKLSTLTQQKGVNMKNDQKYDPTKRGKNVFCQKTWPNKEGWTHWLYSDPTIRGKYVVLPKTDPIINWGKLYSLNQQKGVESN